MALLAISNYCFMAAMIYKNKNLKL